MAQVTLSYTAQVGLQSAAVMSVKLGAIPIYQGELDFLGLKKISDTPSVADGEAVRTIVLETTAFGDTLWPDATSLAYATKNLYKLSLAYRLPGKIVAADPVVS